MRLPGIAYPAAPAPASFYVNGSAFAPVGPVPGSLFSRIGPPSRFAPPSLARRYYTGPWAGCHPPLPFGEHVFSTPRGTLAC